MTPARFRRTLACAATVTIALGLAPGVAAAQQDPETCPPSVGLTNSSFEQPAVRGPWLGPQSQVPGWSTTAGDGVIEVWGPGNGHANGGVEVPAATGDQFAELNATQASTLYQDVATTPGQTLRWRISHRARNVTGGVDKDTMNVLIGTPAAQAPQNPDGASSPDIVDDDTAWGQWTGEYKVPAGQSSTRFAFKAVRTASGNATLGNFLDAIEFGTSACLITTKSVAGPNPAQAGDELTYTVKVTNSGGAAALDAVVTDEIPDGTEYVPGSLTLDGAAVTDEPDPAVKVALPSPFEPDRTATITFKVRATGDKTPLDNTASTDYTDGLTRDKDKSTSNTVTNPVVTTTPTTTTTTPTTTTTTTTVAPTTVAPTSTPVMPAGGSTPLPSTGASAGPWLGAAVVLLGLGAGLVFYARRRRT
jgi:uncharacterized repeat protein (TIGR01451 family)/LPXTG-motif cell wall-anchored protein